MSGSMSRRGRAVAFLVLALVAAALAAAIADGYGSSVVRGYGALRPVVVAAAGLPRAKPIGPAQVSTGLEVRRVPERFVPPGALAAPEEALGLVPAVALPAGSYLLASQLQPPRRKRGGALGLGARPSPGRDLGQRRRRAARRRPGCGGGEGRRGGDHRTERPRPGRTYVAAAGVPLIGLGPGDDGPGPGGLAAATLGLTKSQALALIAAESFARQVTLLPVG